MLEKHAVGKLKTVQYDGNVYKAKFYTKLGAKLYNIMKKNCWWISLFVFIIDIRQ